MVFMPIVILNGKIRLKLIKDKNLRKKFDLRAENIEQSYSLKSWSVIVEQILIDAMTKKFKEKIQNTTEANTIKSFEMRKLLIKLN